MARGLLGELPSAATPAEGLLLFSKRGIIAHANGSLYGMTLDHTCSFCFSLSVKCTCYIFRNNENLALDTTIKDTSLIAGGKSGDETRFFRRLTKRKFILVVRGAKIKLPQKK